ncbi:uncharacterized protein [Panulirus ornatus]|uniref:uncharacterized protein n=1 Tax=Panulirus ornatus TaxID=150431 RepID=UPI003A849A90
MTIMNVRKMMMWVACFLICLLTIAGYVSGVRIKKLDVPAVAIEGDEVHLRCDYEDEGGSSLYTLKWYKDAHEFYRHQPGISPLTANDRCVDHHTYAVEGINVDCWVSTEREVVLKAVTKLTSGQYRCEVIGEHPTFRKEVRDGRLTVYSEPLQPPQVAGVEKSYAAFDYVSLNCTSLNTEYLPQLSWVINGRPAHQSYVRQVEQGTISLFFQARSDLFERGVIAVSCVTSLDNHHRRSTQVQLSNRDYLSAEEYYFNTGKKKTPAPVLLASATFLLPWLTASLLPLA